MVTEVSKQLDRIEDGCDDIVSAIKNKGITVPDGAKIDELASYVSSIKGTILQNKTVTPKTSTQTVAPDKDYDGLSEVIVNPIPSIYVNTSSGDAVAGDMLAGKKAWVDGKEVVGTLPMYDYSEMEAEMYKINDDYIGVSASVTKKSIIEDVVYSKISMAEFGDAKASDVQKGKTFTSADGVKVVGTYEAPSIKTCTVNIKFSITPSAPLISATVLSNGAISNYYNRHSNTTGTITIPNVVCGSALSVHAGVYSSLYGWSHGYNRNNDGDSYVLFVPTSEGTYTAEIGVLDD